MIHVQYFIARKAGMDEAEFHRYWRETHAPLAAGIPQLRRYLQSHRIAAPNNNSSHDGAAEIWFDSLEALAAFVNSPEYRNGAFKDEPNFVDLARVERMTTRDYVLNDGPAGGSLVKGIWQLPRKPGMSLGRFRKYWLEVHGPLALKLPGLGRYVQSHLIDEAYRYADPRFDGVAQLWFASAEAMAAAFASPAGKALAADGAEFIDTSRMRYFLAQEHIVVASR